MPATQCVQCSSLGFVHEERIINGVTIVVKYRCERCNFSWEASEGERSPDRDTFVPPGPKPSHRAVKTR